MASKISLYVFLLFVCFLHERRLAMTVTAQPTVTATILTPEADRKEGGMIHMRCVAANLQQDFIVEWTTADPFQSLRFGETTVSGTDIQFMFETRLSSTETSTTQDLTITNLHRQDAGDYICNVHKPLLGGGTQTLAFSRITLSVLYFPNESFPVCYPDGHTVVDNGTELNVRCSSEFGNPPVSIGITQTPVTSNRWKALVIDDMALWSLDMTLGVADNGVQFKCFISSTSFVGMRRSCTIGPFSVRNAMERSLIVPVVVASAVAGGGLILVGILVYLYLRNKRCRKNNLTRTEAQVSNADPYTELQKPTGGGNREYMELGARGAAAGYTKQDKEVNVEIMESATWEENQAKYQTTGEMTTKIQTLHLLSMRQSKFHEEGMQ